MTTPLGIGMATLVIGLVGTIFAAMSGWSQFEPRSLEALLGLSSLLAHIVPVAVLLVWLAVVPHGIHGGTTRRASSSCR